MTSFPSIHYLSPSLSFSVLSSPRTPPNPNPLSRLHYFRPSLVSLLFPSTPIRLYPFSLLPLFLSFPSLPFFHSSLPFSFHFFLFLLIRTVPLSSHSRFPFPLFAFLSLSSPFLRCRVFFCRYVCIFELSPSYGQRIIRYRPTFAFSRAANLSKTVSEMSFGIMYYN